MESISITDRAARTVEAGGLWIFSNEILSKSTQVSVGSWCRFTNAHRFVALGYFNPHSLIAGRVVSLQETDDLANLLQNRLEESMRRRIAFKPTDSGRLVFSEADFIPGLVLDSFSGVLVLQSNTAGIDTVLPLLEKLVPETYTSVFGKKPLGFVIRGDSAIRRLESVPEFHRVIIGDAAALRNGSFFLDGIEYAANFLEGQKTGFFLDQRDNRRALVEWLSKNKGANVLDLFSYSGGWGLAALKAGAAQVTFVDESESALDLIRRGLKQNKLSEKAAMMVPSDVFDFLEKDTDLYDVIVADPPAFVKSKKNLPQAIRAYEKLNRLCWRRLKPGGVLFSSSCSYHLSESEFLNLLQSAVAKEKTWAQVVFHGGQASDHPVLLSMPETRYLKCIGLKKI